MSMTYPLRIADQLRPHLRALRKRRGLTQAQLGALVGVKQARIAEIEAQPGAVSLDQLTRLLAVLGGTLHLHAEDETPPEPAPRAKPKPKAKAARPAKRSSTAPVAPAVKIPAKKGVW